MKMDFRFVTAAALSLLVSTPTLAQSQQSAQEIISGWPEKPRTAAEKMIKEHGQPSGVTASRLIWEDLDNPWHEIIAYKKTVDHDFPIPHQDYVEHAVLYEVPADKMDELAKFDGSVIVYRTEGRLAARCHAGGPNILTLNLAQDIIAGEKNVDEARQAYSEAIKQAKTGSKPEIMQKLNFEPMSPEAAAQTDQPTVKL